GLPQPSAPPGGAARTLLPAEAPAGCAALPARPSSQARADRGAGRDHGDCRLLCEPYMPEQPDRGSAPCGSGIPQRRSLRGRQGGVGGKRNAVRVGCARSHSARSGGIAKKADRRLAMKAALCEVDQIPAEGVKKVDFFGREVLVLLQDGKAKAVVN